MRLTVLRKPADPLVQLVPSHLVLEQIPLEGGLGVDVADLLHFLIVRRASFKLLGYRGADDHISF